MNGRKGCFLFAPFLLFVEPEHKTRARFVVPHPMFPAFPIPPRPRLFQTLLEPCSIPWDKTAYTLDHVIPSPGCSFAEQKPDRMPRPRMSCQGMKKKKLDGSATFPPKERIERSPTRDFPPLFQKCSTSRRLFQWDERGTGEKC